MGEALQAEQGLGFRRRPAAADADERIAGAGRGRSRQDDRLQDVGRLGLPAQVLVQAGRRGQADVGRQPRLAEVALDEDRAAAGRGRGRGERRSPRPRRLPLARDRDDALLGQPRQHLAQAGEVARAAAPRPASPRRAP